MRTVRPILFSVLCLTLWACDTQSLDAVTESDVAIDPLAEDFFYMRNPEIRADLLDQLAIHNIDFWINDDQSIGFYVKDTEEVDRLANEAIGVYISLQ